MSGKCAIKIKFNKLIFSLKPNELEVMGKIANEQSSPNNRKLRTQVNFACVQQLADFAICGAFHRVHVLESHLCVGPYQAASSTQRHFFCTFARPEAKRRSSALILNIQSFSFCGTRVNEQCIFKLVSVFVCCRFSYLAACAMQEERTVVISRSSATSGLHK